MNTDEERLEAAIDDELVLWLVVVLDDVCTWVGFAVSPICASCLSSFAADFWSASLEEDERLLAVGFWFGLLFSSR